jgi:hypothetical protein
VGASVRATRISSPTSRSGSNAVPPSWSDASVPSSAPVSIRMSASPQVPGWGGGQGAELTAVTSARSVGAVSPAASSVSASPGQRIARPMAVPTATAPTAIA